MSRNEFVLDIIPKLHQLNKHKLFHMAELFNRTGQKRACLLTCLHTLDNLQRVVLTTVP